jgi:hypothetical protein
MEEKDNDLIFIFSDFCAEDFTRLELESHYDKR